MTLVHYWAICPLIQWFSKAMTHNAGASDCVWAAISSPVLCWTTESPSPCLAAFPRRLVVTLSVPTPSKTMISAEEAPDFCTMAQLNTSAKSLSRPSLCKTINCSLETPSLQSHRCTGQTFFCSSLDSRNLTSNSGWKLSNDKKSFKKILWAYKHQTKKIELKWSF